MIEKENCYHSEVFYGGTGLVANLIKM
jgi:hypothetical protein